MARCTNIECQAPVRWSESYGDGVWVHTTTRDRKCPETGFTPPYSQRRQRPSELFWHCPVCGEWNTTVEDAHGTLKAVCTGPARLPHDPVTWRQVDQLDEPAAPPPVPEVRMSPDHRLTAIRTGERLRPWRSSDGTRRTDRQVANWLVLQLPSEEEGEIEYGIEYHYSPGRWHVLPNVIFSEPVEAAKSVLQRNKSRNTEDYRPVQRRAAGPWEPLVLAL